MQCSALTLHFRSYPGFQIHTSMWIVEIYEHWSEINVTTATLVREFSVCLLIIVKQKLAANVVLK